MAKSTKADALETREKLLDAAEDVFHRKGVTQTSLMDIAAEAGMTRGAIYWHFKNKSDIFNAMCERVHLPMEAMLDASTDMRLQDPLGEFSRRTIATLKLIASNPRWKKVLDVIFNRCELINPKDPIMVRAQQCRSEVKEKLMIVFQNAKDKGQLPQDLDLERCERFMHAIFTGMIEDWLFEAESFDLHTEAESIVLTCIHAFQHAPSLRKLSTKG